MGDIKSGKDLCDDFFENLLKRKDINLQVARLLNDLYSAGNLTKDGILQGLKSLIKDTSNEQQT
jgi:hypothetical protein